MYNLYSEVCTCGTFCIASFHKAKFTIQVVLVPPEHAEVSFFLCALSYP